MLQGLGAGMILPIGQTILAQAAGPQRMGRVMSVTGVPMLLAPVFGARGGAGAWGGMRLDVRGLLLSPGIAVFLYGMSEAGGHGGFGSPRTIVAVRAGLALIALFFRHAAVRGRIALIDVSLLRRRGFGAAAAVNLLLMVALFGSLILIPLYYQQVRHEGTGSCCPQGLGAALALPLAGRLTDKFGARGVASAGMVLAALGMLAYTQVGAGTSYLYLSAALLAVGAGAGATVVPSMAAAFQSLTRAETPRGTSAINVIQRLGGAIGTALFAIVLSGQTRAEAGARGVGGVGALAGAFGTTFWVAAGLIALAVAPALLLPGPRRADEANANAGSGAAADRGRAAAA